MKDISPECPATKAPQPQRSRGTLATLLRKKSNQALSFEVKTSAAPCESSPNQAQHLRVSHLHPLENLSKSPSFKNFIPLPILNTPSAHSFTVPDPSLF